MYPVFLTLHNLVRWLALIAMLYALIRAWRGYLGKHDWTQADNTAALAFALALTLQAVFGVFLYFTPEGLAQSALQNFGASMKSADLRFFALEHPLQMTIAQALTYWGVWQTRKATSSAILFRHAVIFFSIAALLILVGVPWSRPLWRGF